MKKSNINNNLVCVRARPAGRRAGIRTVGCCAAALLLAASLIFSGCSAATDGPEPDTSGAAATQPDIQAQSTAPEDGADTSEAPGTAEQTAPPPAVTDAPNETSSESVTADLSKPAHSVNVLRSMYASDSLGSSETDAEKARIELLSKEYGIILNEAMSEKAVEEIKNLILAGDGRYDIVIPSLNGEASQLITDGLLVDLSLKSLGLRENISGLTADLAIKNRAYLLFCDAVTSDIFAAPALDITDAGAAVPVLSQLSAENRLTFALMAEQLAAGTDLNADADGLLSLLGAAGGSLFVSDDAGLPAVNLKSPVFAEAYKAVSSVSAGHASAGSVGVTLVSADVADRILIPLPKLSSDSWEITPLRTACCSAIAVPITSMDSDNLASALTAIIKASSGIRAEAVSSAKKGPEGRAQTIDRMLASLTADAGEVFDWAEISDLVSGHLSAGDSLESIFADRLYSLKEKAAANAAAIISERLG